MKRHGDAGGPGRPVVDVLRKDGFEPVAVLITGGKRMGIGAGGVTVPKRVLVQALQAVFTSGRLKVAKGLPLADALLDELAGFQEKITARGHDTYAARAGEHDDLVLAVALAVWFADPDAAVAVTSQAPYRLYAGPMRGKLR